MTKGVNPNPYGHCAGCGEPKPQPDCTDICDACVDWINSQPEPWNPEEEHGWDYWDLMAL